ncbi:MAG: MarR family transcriptional regulator [Candidatus Thiodiazotropha sp.]
MTEYLGQTEGSVSQTIKLLEQKGLLLRRSDTKDRRGSHLELTKKGHKLLDRLVPPPMLIKACDKLPQKAHKQINHALHQLVMALLESLAHTPACLVQAFIPGTNALALQFHIEAGAFGIEPWLIGHTGEIGFSQIP